MTNPKRLVKQRGDKYVRQWKFTGGSHGADRERPRTCARADPLKGLKPKYNAIKVGKFFLDKATPLHELQE